MSAIGRRSRQFARKHGFMQHTPYCLRQNAAWRARKRWAREHR